MRWNLVEIYNFLLSVLLTVLMMAASTTNSSTNYIHTNHVTTDVIVDIIMPSVNVDQPYISYTVNTVSNPIGERLKIRTDFDVTRIRNSHTP
jgi:hypothetical protein